MKINQKGCKQVYLDYENGFTGNSCWNEDKLKKNFKIMIESRE